MTKSSINGGWKLGKERNCWLLHGHVWLPEGVSPNMFTFRDFCQKVGHSADSWGLVPWYRVKKQQNGQDWLRGVPCPNGPVHGPNGPNVNPRASKSLLRFFGEIRPRHCGSKPMSNMRSAWDTMRTWGCGDRFPRPERPGHLIQNQILAVLKCQFSTRERWVSARFHTHELLRIDDYHPSLQVVVQPTRSSCQGMETSRNHSDSLAFFSKAQALPNREIPRIIMIGGYPWLNTYCLIFLPWFNSAIIQYLS